jgi:subtilisin family serine protease
MAVLDQKQPVLVNQSSMAVLDQNTATMLQSPSYAAFGHGTMVSGIIHLVAPTAQIMPLKAFNADGSGYTSDVLRAIYYATQNGANILNMSFSFPTYSQEMLRAEYFANRKGVVSVASAGNDGKDVLVYPAAYLNLVMGIASTSNNDTLSSFSNYGADLVWVAAPGEGIVSTYPFGTYAAGWGTSFSAPFVAGGAALLLSVQPNLNEHMAAQGLSHAKWISSDLGNGRVDLYLAVGACRSPGPCN